MEWFIPLIALTAMEVVLGIDNIVFIAILADRLPQAQRTKARFLGLAAALVTRLLLLFCVSFVLGLDQPVFQLSDLGLAGEWLFGHEEVDAVSWKDIILVVGGLFLLWKSVNEIHKRLEGTEEERGLTQAPSLHGTIVQIALIDIVFSLDSVITAVGMVENIVVIAVAIVVAICVMLVFSEPIGRFVERHPTVKMLALSFLILIGIMLVAEGIGTHMDKGYIYFAMAFALAVEILNLRMRAKAKLKSILDTPADVVRES